MQISRHEVIRRVGLSLAGALLLALAAWLAVRLAGAHRLSAARERFEAEVGPLPRIIKPGGGSREPAFIQRLGGPARLPDEADLTRIRQLLWRGARGRAAAGGGRGRPPPA